MFGSKNCINAIHQAEINKMVIEGHQDALIALVEDSYHQGMHDGAIRNLAGLGIAAIILGYSMKKMDKHVKNTCNHE